MEAPIFDPDSVIQEDTDINNFVPPNPGWNWVTILNHPKDPHHYPDNRCGKWLLFVPHKDFVKVFRKLAKLAKNLELTHNFKASGGTEEKHVFCVYCQDYSQIPFIKEIANTLSDKGLIEKYGYQYKNGTKAIYFKTDKTTEYKSSAVGESLTLFKFTNKKELFVKEFNNGKPSWELVTNKAESSIIKNFEFHLRNLEWNTYNEEE